MEVLLKYPKEVKATVDLEIERKKVAVKLVILAMEFQKNPVQLLIKFPRYDNFKLDDKYKADIRKEHEILLSNLAGEFFGFWVD